MKTLNFTNFLFTPGNGGEPPFIIKDDFMTKIDHK